MSIVLLVCDRPALLSIFGSLSLSYHTRRKTGEVLRVLDRGSAINGVSRKAGFDTKTNEVTFSLHPSFFKCKFEKLLLSGHWTNFTLFRVRLSFQCTNALHGLSVYY